MRIEGHDSIGGSPERVWALLIDPRRAGSCVPGIGGIEIVDATHFRITKVGLGTVRAQVKVDVEEADRREPEHVAFLGNGRARGLSVRAKAEIDLTDGEVAGTTDLAWSIDVKLNGPLAIVGTRMIDRSASSLITQTLRCMNVRMSDAPTARKTAVISTRERVIRFDPNWCLFWGHDVTGWQLDIWLPYLKHSRNRFAIMTPDDIGQGDREKVAALPNAIVVEPYVQGLDWLRACRGFRGYLYVGTRPENFVTVNRHGRQAHVWIGHGESGKGTSGFRTGRSTTRSSSRSIPSCVAFRARSGRGCGEARSRSGPRFSKESERTLGLVRDRSGPSSTHRPGRGIRAMTTRRSTSWLPSCGGWRPSWRRVASRFSSGRTQEQVDACPR